MDLWLDLASPTLNGRVLNRNKKLNFKPNSPYIPKLRYLVFLGSNWYFQFALK